MLLAHLLKSLIREGSLGLIDARGRRHEFGNGAAPRATIRLHDRALHRKLALNPALHAGEAYMEGSLTIEEGTLYDFLDIGTRNMMVPPTGHTVRMIEAASRLTRLFQQFNPARRARRNVAHHYDLSGALYDLFLDADRQYSCAYFETPQQDLEAAQAGKKRHIAAKLLIDRPNLDILDIGCGWGGLALFLARETGARVTGITLSEEQLKVARERADKAGLADRVQFHLKDYRLMEGRFDRIVSVGMFEHVGLPHYNTFFARLRTLLAPGGVALLHTIGRLEGPGATNPWIRKYIFPGGYSPALSEILPAIERQQLFTTDIEVLRLHYAMTLRAWRDRFEASRDKAASLFDERFCRMWEFYLVGCELAFRNQGHAVFQIQMSNLIDAVPLTRDYIAAFKADQGTGSTSAA